MECTIRNASWQDAARINDIANWYIENTATNFDTEPWSLEKRQIWVSSFNQSNSPYKLLVCESETTTSPNQPSIALHQRLGFTAVGTFDEIGYKFGTFHSVSMYQKKLR